MPLVDFIMPQMGESVTEGTILSWLKQVGDTIEEDESLLEVATDKVDTEIPSTLDGTLAEILVPEGEIAQVGSVIAKIETSAEQASEAKSEEKPAPAEEKTAEPKSVVEAPKEEQKPETPATTAPTFTATGEPQNNGFYSPLVMSIAKEEGISQEELRTIKGTGKDQRLSKKDILAYVSNRGQAPAPIQQVSPSLSGASDIIQMDRMRKMIADRMLESRRTSAHVTSFVEADVTNIVYWRNRKKHYFMDTYGSALTFTPIMIEAVVKALKDYPMMNISVDGDKIIKKHNINIGMAVALPNGNLIVPVIKNADRLNLVGLTKAVNDLAKRARNNKLTADDLSDGTYTVSNMGSFGNVMGTPILVQPQVGILALGAIEKKPAVIETPTGDTIGIRHKMFLSHSYDHRVVDGALGGMFVRRVADYLERFSLDTEV